MTDSEPQSMLCPVCRARQRMQGQCRRCAADLTLYCRALTAAAVCKARYAAARQRGDDQAASSELAYLTWLSPREAAGLQQTS